MVKFLGLSGRLSVIAIIGLVAGFVSSVQPHSVSAATLVDSGVASTVSYNVQASNTTTFNISVDLDLFDSALGDLQSISLNFETTATRGNSVSAFFGLGTTTSFWTLSTSLTRGAIIDTEGPLDTSGQVFCSNSSGFCGNTRTFSDTTLAASLGPITDPFLFSTFTGSGTFAWDASLIVSTGVSGSGIGKEGATFGDFDANATVTYEYTPASVVPVPAALPLLLSGLFGLGALGWRRKRKVA